MLLWFEKSFVLRDMFDENREIYNFGSISRFILQNITGCSALSNSMVSVLMLNRKRQHEILTAKFAI